MTTYLKKNSTVGSRWSKNEHYEFSVLAIESDNSAIYIEYIYLYQLPLSRQINLSKLFEVRRGLVVSACGSRTGSPDSILGRGRLMSDLDLLMYVHLSVNVATQEKSQWGAMSLRAFVLVSIKICPYYIRMYKIAVKSHCFYHVPCETPNLK